MFGSQWAMSTAMAPTASARTLPNASPSARMSAVRSSARQRRRPVWTASRNSRCQMLRMALRLHGSEVLLKRREVDAELVAARLDHLPRQDHPSLVESVCKEARGELGEASPG